MGILDLLKEIPLSAVLKEKLTDFEKENISLKKKVSDLETENSVLKGKLEQSENQRRALEKQIMEVQSNTSSGYVCDHCGSTKLRRTGNRPDPTFGRLGIKQSVFVCEECGKNSSFTQERG